MNVMNYRCGFLQIWKTSIVELIFIALLTLSIDHIPTKSGQQSKLKVIQIYEIYYVNHWAFFSADIDSYR